MAKIDWQAIDKDLVEGMTPKEAGFKYNVKENTIQKHILRTKLPVPSQALVRNLGRQLANVQEKVVIATVEQWLERGEKHREKMFDIATESIDKFTPKAPKNFKELKTADDIARRAAGLDISDTKVQTLINVNERIESFDDEVVEAEVVETASGH